MLVLLTTSSVLSLRSKSTVAGWSKKGGKGSKPQECVHGQARAWEDKGLAARSCRGPGVEGEREASE